MKQEKESFTGIHDKWKITYCYNEEKEPLDFEECMALFEFLKKHGMDSHFREVSNALRNLS